MSLSASKPATPDPQRALPAWAEYDPLSFLRLGLLAERRADGHAVANVKVIGGLGGQHVEPDWGRRTMASYLLALTVVKLMLTYPDQRNCALAPYLTSAFRRLPQGSQLLDDGHRVTPWETQLAQALADAIVYPSPDSQSLSIPMLVLTTFLSTHIQTRWPDKA